MRQPTRSNFIVIVVVALCASFAGVDRAWADDPRVEARTHYQAGVKAYSGGDYKSAIKEFSSAQQLAPADINNYNLALCYDKLGDAEPAIQYYKEYLAKVPDAAKRAEIEASVSRLEGALKSSAAKRADEAKRADDERKKADDAKAADDAKHAADTKKADDAKAPPNDIAAVAGAGAAAGAGAGVGVGSTGTPGTGQAVSTGDAQLDRVSSIDISSIRDQRLGGSASGMPDPRDTRGGPNVGPAERGWRARVCHRRQVRSARRDRSRRTARVRCRTTSRRRRRRRRYTRSGGSGSSSAWAHMSSTRSRRRGRRARTRSAASFR